MKISQLSPGIFEIASDEKRGLATVNLTPGRTVYGEQLTHLGDIEYRAWSPYRSKLSAAILKGIKNIPIALGNRVLYLGVASGTTCSHISDIVGADGHVWGIDFAPRPFRDFIDNLVRYRGNISPILADAHRPELYSGLVPRVDVIYADVAQVDQSNIVAMNTEFFLRRDGWAMMAIKSRSIDVNRPPQRIYSEQAEDLRGRGFDIVDLVELEPYEMDHAMVVARYVH